MTYVLWIIQGLLALLFLWAGGMKLVLPIEAMTEQMPLPGLFLRFIGVAEVLGALGLILPGLLHLWPGLTPLAAVGLVLIMIGATVFTLASGACSARVEAGCRAQGRTRRWPVSWTRVSPSKKRSGAK